MNLTEKSDEDDASNSTAAVLKQEDRPRRAQPDRLQEPKIDQCSNSAEKKEFDLFAYIFNRDGEEDQPEEEDSPLVDVTVDSDEDGASNSTAAVIQPQQPQSSRLPRRTQPSKLQEPATDSEKEEDDGDGDDESSDEEASSSSRTRPVQTETNGRGSKSNFYPLEIMKFNQLEEKDKEGAQRVFDLYRDERKKSCVLVCSLFISGKCRFMSKRLRDLCRHMKRRHQNEKHAGYKIIQYPGFKDRKISDFVTKSFSELKRTGPQLAEKVLALYKRPQNKSKQKVHLCGHFVRGKCQYFSMSSTNVKSHMARKHSRTLPIIKIVGYPGGRERTRHKYEQMTYAELKSKRSKVQSKVADEVLKYYYHHNCRGKVHLCGSCDYFSYSGKAVRDHIASHHPPTTRIYKIIKYPRLELD